MRIDLNDENTAKAQDAERQLKEKYGVQASPNQIVNIFFAAIESAELHRLVEITLCDPGKTPKSNRPPKKVSKTAENWVLNWK